MAEAHGILQGNRGSVTRLGSKASGISATLNTWKTQVSTDLQVAKDNKHCDYIRINVSGYQRDRTRPVIIRLIGLQTPELGDKLFINGKEYTEA